MPGPVPPRVDGEVKERLLKLIDDAVSGGWAQARACAVLEVADVRVHRWRARHRDHGTLVDRAPVGAAVHRLLGWEERAILDLAEQWAPVDRSHRKLAHRGSYLGTVFVSPSTLRRVLSRNGIDLPEPPPRRVVGFVPPWPSCIEWAPNQIWMWDGSWFAGAKRHCVAIVDVVSRYWIDHLLSAEFTSTQSQLLFARAVDGQGLDTAGGHGLHVGGEGAPPGQPVLVAWSDNGPQMTSEDTREFMALMAIWQHHGRPHTPTDQAEIESFFGHVKGDWPHLERIRDPAVLDAELDRVRMEYNAVRLHAGLGYVTPDDEHHGRDALIRRARRQGLRQARQNRIDYNRAHDRPGAEP